MADMAGITIPVDTSQIEKGIREIARLEQQLVKLEVARRRGNISQQQFDASLAKLSTGMNAFAVDTQQATQEIIRFGNGLNKLDAQGLNNIGRGLGESQKGFAKFGLAAQQSGYQVGDFFVQVASGTSPMVAFTQQFSQLAGFFGGPWGAVIGAVAAIGGAAWIAFSKASEGVDGFEKAIDDAKTRLEELKDEITTLKLGFVDEEQLALLKSAIALSQEKVRLEMEAAETGDPTGAIQAEINGKQILIDQAHEQIDAITQANKQLEEQKVIADLIAEGFSKSVIEGMKLAGVDLSNISEAARRAAEMAESFNVAYSLGLAMSSGLNYGKLQNEFGSGPDAARSEVMGNRSSPFGTVASGAGGKAPAARGKRGGGSNPAEQLRNQYESLLGSLDPLVAAQNQYNQSLEMLNKALAAGAINQKEFEVGLAAIKERLEEAKDPLNSFKQGLEDALDPNKNYIKGLQALQSSIAEFLFNPFEVGLDGMVLGFSRALQRMASEALAAGFMKMLVGGAFGATGSAGAGILSFLSPNANGNAFAGGNIIPFANGGVVGGPMTFPMGGGKTGLMGEAGPEAIMPLKRGQDGKLGVASQGSASNNIKIVNVLDGAVVGNYLNTPEGEEVIMNVMRRTGVA